MPVVDMEIVSTIFGAKKLPVRMSVVWTSAPSSTSKSPEIVPILRFEEPSIGIEEYPIDEDLLEYLADRNSKKFYLPGITPFSDCRVEKSEIAALIRKKVPHAFS